MNHESKRVAGVITSVWEGVEDHGIDTLIVGLDLDDGHQGFGGLCFGTPRLSARKLVTAERDTVKASNLLFG